MLGQLPERHSDVRELFAETVSVVLCATHTHTHTYIRPHTHTYLHEQSGTAAISAPRSNHPVITVLRATPGFLFPTSQSFCGHGEKKRKTHSGSLRRTYIKRCSSAELFNTKQVLRGMQSFGMKTWAGADFAPGVRRAFSSGWKCFNWSKEICGYLHFFLNLQRESTKAAGLEGKQQECYTVIAPVNGRKTDLFRFIWRTRGWETELAEIIRDRSQKDTEISELVWYGYYLKVQCVGRRGIWLKCNQMFISFSFVSDNNRLKQRAHNQPFISTDRVSPLLWSLPCFSYSGPEWTN